MDGFLWMQMKAIITGLPENKIRIPLREDAYIGHLNTSGIHITNLLS